MFGIKSKRNGNSDNILFINASKEYKAGKNQNELLEEHVNKIVEAYVNRVDVDGFAHVATMDEIIENDYNLNIPRYVDTSEKEADVDISQVKREIEEIQAKKKVAISNVYGKIAELGI